MEKAATSNLNRRLSSWSSDGGEIAIRQLGLDARIGELRANEALQRGDRVGHVRAQLIGETRWGGGGEPTLLRRTLSQTLRTCETAASPRKRSSPLNETSALRGGE